MQKIMIYDLIVLQEHFARKKRPTKEDRARAEKIENHLRALVDGAVMMEFTRIPELTEKP